MRSIFFCALVISGLCVSTFIAAADEENCAACDRLVRVSGQFPHFKTNASRAIQGVPADDQAAFCEEIFGSNFTVTVSHLPAGKYELMFGGASDDLRLHLPLNIAATE
jgi:hypothetical protein